QPFAFGEEAVNQVDDGLAIGAHHNFPGKLDDGRGGIDLRLRDFQHEAFSVCRTEHGRQWAATLRKKRLWVRKKNRSNPCRPSACGRRLLHWGGWCPEAGTFC